MKRRACWSCGNPTSCEQDDCHQCVECCGCDDDDFDADELGIDPEEAYDA